MTTDECVQQLGNLARQEGFFLSGISAAVDLGGFNNLVRWIEQGYAAEMDYFLDRLDAYRNPSGVLPGVRSILALAYPYPEQDARPLENNHGRVARYAWSGVDYHDVIHPKLKRLCRFLREQFPDCNARGVVDTAPLLEREIAQLAGLGWRGKNTLLLNKHHGSYFFLAFVLVDIELPYDDPHESAHCGTCTKCLDACPTKAFPQAGVLDASKCISYLTIEHRGEFPEEIRAAIGDWVFGCDICQEVCPWNRKSGKSVRPGSDSRFSDESDPSVGNESLNLEELFYLSDDQFRERFRRTPMWRTRRRGLLRNAAVVLGNVGTIDSIKALSIGTNDDEELVRDHCAWAIARIRERG